MVQQGHGLGSRALVCLHQAANGRGDHHAAGFPDAATGHAGVYGLDHDGAAASLDLLGQQVGDLRSEPLLHLRPLRE